MRNVICCLSLLMTTLMVGCGQTGALQLPSDPNYDKRAQYLLYKNAAAQAKSDQTMQKQADQVIDQSTASEITTIP